MWRMEQGGTGREPLVGYFSSGQEALRKWSQERRAEQTEFGNWSAVTVVREGEESG